ncbi:hypothetical protein KDI_39770 [Dictyobacter arantiisoli]|uniref:Bacterial sugar transferase domain-containing protein n=2 Tax=Dictyobacter arantiisoli TaxID=2014874 RepID=A0A5A5TH66_9CHLR|nr:hypothetical protein KDI_39770 [Dictyobacter arantiisoli]
MIQHGCVDMLIVATDNPFESLVSQDILHATPHEIYIFSLAELYELSMGKVASIHAENTWPIVLTFYTQLSLGYRCWHWLLDMCFALLGSCLLILVLPMIATLICLDSPGPIFYWQERVGHRGRLFRILKFRSMRVDAEQCGASWATPMDLRVTRVGRILRALHLDELPQVINILRGEMSLIGPRPERLSFVLPLEQALPLFQYRLAIKPGLTGWAQVKAPYASSLPESAIKLQHDLYYIKHQSFTLDICILFKTIIEIFWCSGR